jgi:hypothetical protein
MTSSAGRDVIFGDQYNYNFQQQVAQIQSPQEFVAKLHELQKELTQIKQQPDVLPDQKETLQLVEGQVSEVIEEALKPRPASERIVAKLKSAKAVMDSLGDGVKSAIGFGTVIAGFGAIALKLFGG